MCFIYLPSRKEETDFFFDMATAVAQQQQVSGPARVVDDETPAYQRKFVLDMINGRPTGRQEDCFENICEQHTEDGFVVGIAYPNASDGDGIGPTTGVMLIMAPDERVNAADFGPDVFAVTVATRIYEVDGKKPTREAIARKMDLLHQAAPTYVNRSVAPSFNVRRRGTSQSPFIDKNVWMAELGSNGRATIGSMTVGHEEQFYSMVHCAPDLVSEHLKNWVRGKPMTYAQLVNSGEFRHAQHLVKRSARRLLYNVNTEMGFRTSSEGERDEGSVHAAVEVPPNLAVPDIMYFTSTVAKISHQGKPGYAVYNDVIPAQGIGQYLLVDNGAWEGTTMYSTGGSERVKYGWPASTRKLKHHSQVTVDPVEHEDLLRARQDRFVWEGKGVGNKFPSVLLDGLQERTKRNQHFKGCMRRLGLRDEEAVGQLLPVACKIATPWETRPLE